MLVMRSTCRLVCTLVLLSPLLANATGIFYNSGQVSKLELGADKKSEEIKHLKEKLAMREADIAWMREETAQRAQALQTAVRNYAQPFSSPS